MNDSLIPAYSSDGLAVRDLFLADFQEVLFYFEDANHEVIYERLIGRLFPHLRFSTVFCLGGKSEVLKKAKEAPQKGKARVFVLDKDFDDLLKKIEHLDELFYLRRYSLENYLVRWEDLKEILVEEFEGKLSLSKICELTSDFDEFWKQIRTRSEQLTRLFVVARRYEVGMPTTKAEYSVYLDNDESGQLRLIPSNEVLAAVKKRLQDSCSVATNEWLADDDALFHELDNAFNVDKNQVILAGKIEDHFCGKHLLGFLLNYADRALGSKLLDMPKKKLYLRLINLLRLEELEYLRTSIVNRHSFLAAK